MHEHGLVCYDLRIRSIWHATILKMELDKFPHTYLHCEPNNTKAIYRHPNDSHMSNKMQSAKHCIIKMELHHRISLVKVQIMMNSFDGSSFTIRIQYFFIIDSFVLIIYSILLYCLLSKCNDYFAYESLYNALKTT